MGMHAHDALPVALSKHVPWPLHGTVWLSEGHCLLQSYVPHVGKQRHVPSPVVPDLHVPWPLHAMYVEGLKPLHWFWQLEPHDTASHSRQSDAVPKPGIHAHFPAPAPELMQLPRPQHGAAPTAAPGHDWSHFSPK